MYRALFGFCILATWAIWDSNYSVTASPSSKLLIINQQEVKNSAATVENASVQTVLAIPESEIIPSPSFGITQDSDKPNQVLRQIEPFFPLQKTKEIANTPSLLAQNTESASRILPNREQVEMPPVDLLLLTSVSKSASDLVIPEHLQVQNSVSEESFPKPPPPPEDQPFDSDDSSDLGTTKKIPRRPNLQLQLQSGVFTSSDIQNPNPINSTVFINNAGLFASPDLGPQTRLIGYAGGSLVRFAEEGRFNYETLNFSLGVRQQLARNTYGQIGWVQDRLYASGNKLSVMLADIVDNSVQLSVNRSDQLAPRLQLNSLYELRTHFTDPVVRSRVTNTLGINLNYSITTRLVGALDYRIVLDDFTRDTRFETRQQVSALGIYQLSENAFIAGVVSYQFGESSVLLNSNVMPLNVPDFNNFSIGINLGLNLPLF